MPILRAADFLTSQIQIFATPTVKRILGNWADEADPRVPRGVRGAFVSDARCRIPLNIIVSRKLPRADFWPGPTETLMAHTSCRCDRGVIRQEQLVSCG